MLAIIVLTLFSILVLYLGFARRRALILPISFLGLAIAFWAIFTHQSFWNQYLQQMISLQGIPKVLQLCLLGTAIAAIPYFAVYQKRGNEELADFSGLFLFSIVGGLLMVSYLHLVVLFIGLEILSIAMYILAGADRRSILSNEASLKYFIMGAFSSAILLFGFSFFYVSTGSLEINAVGLKGMESIHNVSLLMILIGFAFKLALVPFHFWAPDVYQGTPTLFTMLMATVVKIAAFGGLYRFLVLRADWLPEWILWVLVFLILASLLVGNIMAFGQRSIKRLLAYSGIVQAGFICISMIHIKHGNEWPLVFYLIAYAMSSLVSFLIVYFVEEQCGSDDIASFAGLGYSNAPLAAVMTIALISLAGAPLTAGFMAKIFVFNHAIAHGLVSLVVAAVVLAVCSLYYYYKIINAMYVGKTADARWRIHWAYLGIMILLSVLSFGLGLAPAVLTDWIAAQQG